LIALANPANGASWRVLEKIGMQYEGSIRHNNEPLKRYSVNRNPS
jgi:RimJ/RimL family protein N-acetyltransferase